MAVKQGLGELLVRENIINIEQLEAARKDQKSNGGRLTSTIVRMGYVKESDLTEFLSQQYGYQSIDFANFEIDPEVIKIVPRNICEKHNVIPISKVDKTLVVAFSDPSNAYVRDDLALLTRCKIEVVVASEASIASAIDRYYGGGGSQFSSLMQEMEDSEETFTGITTQAEIVDQEKEVDEGPIVRFVNVMLAEAIKSRASDIHIEPYEKRFRIRFRVDGTLHEKTQPPPGTAAAIASRIKILSKLDISQRRIPQDGRLKVRLKNGREVDFRVSVLPTLFGEKVVLRILDKSNLQVDMTKLGMEQDQLDVFKKAIYLPQGMVLITGPTGSGKTTTIYSALAELNTVRRNVSTAEDPVEFNLDGINQVQIAAEYGLGFPEVLRSFLRQDPEIIMVGEIRDLVTAEIGYKAASTGHLVVSTLHTNDAAATVTRLIDMGVAPYMVAEATSLVVAQRLIKKICEKCSVEHKVPPEVLLDLGVKEADLPSYTNLRKGEGCEICKGTGLKGRIAIFEVMKITGAVKDAIFKGCSPLELKRYAIEKEGMHSLRQSALLKLRDGLTTVEEVLNTSVGDDI